MILCPYCAEEIQDAAKVCRFCNKPMPGFESTVPESISPRRKPKPLLYSLLGVIFILLVAIGVSIGTGSWDQTFGKLFPSLLKQVDKTCAVQAAEYITQVDSLIDEWIDQEKITDQTPRMSLPPQISALQDIRRRAGKLEPPLCAETSNNALLKYMDYSIDGYLAFLGKEEDYRVQAHFKKAKDNLETFVDEYRKVKFGP